MDTESYPDVTIIFIKIIFEQIFSFCDCTLTLVWFFLFSETNVKAIRFKYDNFE